MGGSSGIGGGRLGPPRPHRRDLVKKALVGGALVWTAPIVLSSTAAAQASGSSSTVNVYRNSSTAQICGGVGSGTLHGTATFTLSTPTTITVTLSLYGLPNGHAYRFYVGQVGCDCPSSVIRYTHTPTTSTINTTFTIPRCGSASQFVITGLRTNGNHHLHSGLATLV